MRRVPFLLYPGLQPAAPWPAAIDIASFQFNAFLLQVPNQAAAAVLAYPDAYWEEWRVPVRYQRDPRYNAVFAAGEFPWPYVQPAADNANTRWFQPLSEPRREFRFVARIAGEAPRSQVAANPTGVFPDGWFAEWRLPQRAPRDPRYGAAFAAGETPWPNNQPAVDNANTNWFQPFSLPVRFPRNPRYGATLDASGELKWPHNQPASDNANTRWFYPLSEPRREYRFVSRITGETPWPAVAGNPTGVFPSNWYAEWRLPQRALRNPRYGAAFAAGSPPWPYNQPADDNANARWFQALSEPRREYRWIARAVGETPWSRIQPNPISMAWWKALEEPRRFMRNPRYHATLVASGESPAQQPPASSPLGTTRRALLRSGAFPTFWPGAS